MITLIQLLRNVGQFDSESQGSPLPLKKLTLIYAENGRGKTTLAAILRSLGTGDPLPIGERKRLAAIHTPHVILECAGGPPAAMFQNNAWNRSLTQISVFDDEFVDDNVCSGLEVAPDHRQKLHELILGSQGVSLNRAVQTHIASIEQHNRDLRTKADAIPTALRGTLSVDAFCALQPITNVETQIETAERQLAAAKEQQPIRTTPVFDSISLPKLDSAPLNTLLHRDLPSLDANAVNQVQEHLANIGQSGEMWVADGCRRLPAGLAGACPFCAQNLSGSALIAHYRAYFSEAYATLKREIAEAITSFSRTHGEESPLRSNVQCESVESDVIFGLGSVNFHKLRLIPLILLARGVPRVKPYSVSFMQNRPRHLNRDNCRRLPWQRLQPMNSIELASYS